MSTDEPEIICSVGSPVTGIYVAGEDIVFIISEDTVSLLSDPDESFSVNSGAVFAFNNDHLRGTRSVIFADKRNGAFVLSAWLDGKEFVCPEAIGEQEVTALYHSANTGHVIVGLKSGIKIFRYTESSQWQGVAGDFKCNWEVVRINPDQPSSVDQACSFHIIGHDGNHEFLKFSHDAHWEFTDSGINNYLLFAGYNDNSSVKITMYSGPNDAIKWEHPEARNYDIVDLQVQVSSIILPKSNWLSYYAFLLTKNGNIWIADIRLSPDRWTIIRGSCKAIGLREDSKDPEMGASLLLAHGNMVYEYTLDHLQAS